MTDTAALPESKATLEPILRRIQAIAGSLFGVFVLLHLSNIALAPFGIDRFNQYQQTIRAFYQYPLVEIGLVLGPLITHAVAGVGLFFVRGGFTKKGSQTKRPLIARVHGWAGCFLLLFIVGHVLAVRGSSFFYGVFPEFQGVSFSLWYFPAYFYPYYFLLALAGFFHATNGLRMLAAQNGLILNANVQKSMTALAACWIAISLAALGGHLFDVGDNANHDFAQLLETVFGTDRTVPIRFMGGLGL